MFVLSIGFPNPTNLLCLGFQTTSRHKSGCPTLNFFPYRLRISSQTVRQHSNPIKLPVLATRPNRFSDDVVGICQFETVPAQVQAVKVSQHYCIQNHACFRSAVFHRNALTAPCMNLIHRAYPCVFHLIRPTAVYAIRQTVFVQTYEFPISARIAARILPHLPSGNPDTRTQNRQ